MLDPEFLSTKISVGRLRFRQFFLLTFKVSTTLEFWVRLTSILQSLNEVEVPLLFFLVSVRLTFAFQVAAL